MTRKRFWRLRNALNVRLNEWGKANMGGCPSGVTDKKLRPVSGKPLVNMEAAKRSGYGTSYAECGEGLMFLRDGLGM